jgi:hypothetical protein
MGQHPMEFREPRGRASSAWWLDRCAEAQQKRAEVFTEVENMLKRGEIKMWQAYRKLQFAYWKIQRNLYDYEDDMKEAFSEDHAEQSALEARVKAARECV